MKIYRTVLPLLAAGIAGTVDAQVVASARDLADLSLEQLAAIDVTSVSGRAQRLQQAPASIYVITAQEIRRSGATSLPEALRLAPNLQVAQTSASQWAISARGFQDSISNKLLVLLDGRTIYSGLFAGVFWDTNDVVLEDVDRIEVISGPGATLWGANAVNGVINVVTRSASDTRGTLLSAAGGSHGTRAVARWGGRLGSADVRVHALEVDRDSTRLAGNGATRPDASARHQLGFRADWPALGSGALTLQGDVYEGGGDGPANNLAPKVRGGNLLARWSGRFSDGSGWKLQAIHDFAKRDDVNLFRDESRTTDLQFTHEKEVGRGQLLWGAGYRGARDDSRPTASVRFIPQERTLAWSNVFAQYQWAMLDRLQVTAGTKLERNSYTGLEVLPSLRAAWMHSPESTTWAALSRVVRAPSRIDRDFFFPGNPPFLIAGGPAFESEVADVVELGQRGQLGSRVSYSATVYQQRFRGLRAGIPGQVPSTVMNLVDGPVRGVEAWAQWQVTDAWRLMAGYDAIAKRLRYANGISPGTTDFPGLGNDPSHQWTLRSSLNLGSRTEVDVFVRHVGALPNPAVPRYTAVDARVGLQVTPALSLAVIARNLGDPRHIEFNAPAQASLLERRWLLQATLQL
ncbi:TonB-dependent receptor plug domain-containing protein [Ramlibacter algicola]|uniref:TonB-dependent receptor n=1 Tax=Ramlibacter algicola TaxID=2795217 RepID=A0A934Q1K2_9BURK|nr:TonB-dependent receptor [Ramlibacter algicola]MBK0393078.1 TonB-dependent receptor [Ramlibacter algicola]